MKKILVFQKFGRLRFVGHLDIMRVFQRSLRRADIPIVYSQGFNPHPLMSFANPLPLGFSGQKEIMEIVLEQDMTDEEVLQKLGKELPEGLKVVSCRTGIRDKGIAMAKVRAARYDILLPEGYDWPSLWEAFMEQPEILLIKLGKVKGRKQKVQVNAKPWIYEAHLTKERHLDLLCACGSEENLKPDLLIQALYEFSGCPEEVFNEQIDRLCLLSGTTNSYHPLETDEDL